MFNKKFFSTVALSGATVDLMGNIGTIFAEEIVPHDSNILLKCKDDGIDYDAIKDVDSYFFVKNKNMSWSLRDLVRFFHLDRSETEKLLYRMGHCPGWCCRFYTGPGFAQIVVDYIYGGSIWVRKRAKHDYFGSWEYWADFNKGCVDNMLKTDLDTIDFSHSRPKKTKGRPWRMYY